MIKKMPGKALLAASLALSFGVQAAPIPYPNIGFEAPIMSFIAPATGNVNAYFIGIHGSPFGGNGRSGLPGFVPGNPPGFGNGSNPGAGNGIGNIKAGDILPQGPGPSIDEPLPTRDEGNQQQDLLDVDPQSVPEPENVALLGLALVVLGVSRSKRKSS